MSNSCKIVMYHYVRPLKKSLYPEIKGLELEVFLKQIKYFQKNFRILTVDQIFDSINENRTIPDNSILLTFDDGFKDHYLNVFPFLKEKNIQGLFFPPGKIIEEDFLLDVHKIHFILASCNNYQKIIQEIFKIIHQNEDEYNLERPESYYAKLAIPNRFDSKEIIFIKRILQKGLPRSVRTKFTNYLFERFVKQNQKTFAENLYLSLEEIHEMTEGGMYFGSHGYDHEWLTELSPLELEKEMVKSIKFYSRLKQSYNEIIFCYPYGDYNTSVITKVKEKKFSIGLTTDLGEAILTESNRFKLKRYDTNDFPHS